MITSSLDPYKVSSVYHTLEKHGARWTALAGWRVASSFGFPEVEAQSSASGVGLCDLSHHVKVEFCGRGLERNMPNLLGIDFLPTEGRVCITAARPGEVTAVCRITHHQVLVCASDEKEIAPLAQINQDETCLHAVERTSGLACFLLAGRWATDVLNRLTPLDIRDAAFPNLSCSRAPLAHVNARIVRRDRKQLPAYEVFVGREYGEYVWHAIWDAGEQFHITLFGQEARLALEV